jgi:uncharacterized coiled-coil protein SlyX
MWRLDPETIGSLALQGPSATRTPSKTDMYAAGPEAFLEGWLPTAPIIAPETRVVAFGSCFAARFAEWLADHGYNQAFRSDGDEAIVRNQLETPSVVAQQFRWAFGELDPDLAFWVAPDGQRFDATEEHRALLRDTLVRTEMLILTLGIAEYWSDTASGEPIWRRPPADLVASGRYALRVASVAESVAALETIDRIRREYMPQQKVLYTVSPQRLGATFRQMSPIVANVASKAVLRCAVDEFLAAHAGELNETLFYFPAYEVVSELFIDPFEDNMHLRDECVAFILDLFASSYAGRPRGEGVPFPSAPEAELLHTLAAREAKNAELQAECDVRLDVIHRLETSCDERLQVIERLDAACTERQTVIDRLEAELAAAQSVR